MEAASPCQAPDTRPPPRWQVAAAGVAMQVVLGTVYAWSVFKKPLMATHGWSNTQATLAFTLAIIGISLGAAFGGKFVDRAGSRSVALLAAVLFSLGTALAGVADHLGSLWLLWAVGFAVLAAVWGCAAVIPWSRRTDVDAAYSDARAQIAERDRAAAAKAAAQVAAVAAARAAAEQAAVKAAREAARDAKKQKPAQADEA